MSSAVHSCPVWSTTEITNYHINGYFISYLLLIWSIPQELWNWEYLIIPTSIENSPNPTTGRIAITIEVNQIRSTKRLENTVDLVVVFHEQSPWTTDRYLIIAIAIIVYRQFIPVIIFRYISQTISDKIKIFFTLHSLK